MGYPSNKYNARALRVALSENVHAMLRKNVFQRYVVAYD